MNEQKLLEVGDKIRIRNVFNDYIVKIERVTKTKAVSEPYNDGGARWEFKRAYYEGNGMRKIPNERHSMTSYDLIKKK